MNQIFESKTAHAEPQRNAAQERAYQELVDRDAEGKITCGSCGARAKRAEDLSCGH